MTDDNLDDRPNQEGLKMEPAQWRAHGRVEVEGDCASTAQEAVSAFRSKFGKIPEYVAEQASNGVEREIYGACEACDKIHFDDEPGWAYDGEGCAMCPACVREVGRSALKEAELRQVNAALGIPRRLLLD